VYLSHLKQQLYFNRVFYATFCIVWLIGLGYQLAYTQFALSLWINGMHTPALNYTMRFFTFIAEGYWLVLMGIICAALKPRYWLAIICCLLIPSVITQILKHTVFENSHRPAELMHHIHDLYFVPNVEMNRFNSFPSGHTTAAFSLYTLVALLVQGKHWGFVWILIASMVGLSRVYLLQHFWVDILAGSMIGLMCTTLIFAAFDLKHNTPRALT
jgi:membrane-associated phospholipid phosphatase